MRAIRETWGADSGTNVIRRETFYRRELSQKSWLRVHVIPPLDGIYAQWDFNADVVRKFFSSAHPNKEFRIDGRNDEVFGNWDDPCNELYDENERSSIDNAYREAYGSAPLLCDSDQFPYHQSIDLPNLGKSEFNAAYQWNLVTGPHGSIIDRYQIDELTDLTPGGAVQSLAAVPVLPRRLVLRRRHGNRPRPAREAALRRRSRARPRPARRGSAGAPQTACRTEATASTRARSRRTACTSSRSPSRTTRARRSRSRRSWATSASSCCPAGRAAQPGEQYGRGFERPFRRIVVDPPNPSAASG